MGDFGIPVSRSGAVIGIVAVSLVAAPAGVLDKSVESLGAVEWRVYGGDSAGTKYSPLTDIAKDNVSQLEVAWTWRTGERPLAEYGTSPGKFQATPLMLGGVLYLSTPYNKVVALNAETGEEIWTHDPRSYEAGPGPPGVEYGKHRGVAFWTDGLDRRIFINTRWRLIALDASTGERIPEFGRAGEVDLTARLTWEVPEKVHYMSTSPPVVYRDFVIVGSAISDRLIYPKSPPGDVQAFNARTGEHVWTFRTIPQEGEFGNDTWKERSWQTAGHANVWAPMTLDEARGLLYLPVSTPADNYYGGRRKGHNLFGDSLVCLDANTGRRVWHFQTIHHGLWDYDGVMTPNLLRIHVEGRLIDAVAAVSKQGFTYVFDRVTGESVWPIEERPVPQSDVPGEETALTQPFPVKPPPFAKQGFTVDDVIDLTPELRAMALERIKNYRFGPLFTPPSREGTILMPSNGGGANWGAGAVDPETATLYVKAVNWPRLIQLTKVEPQSPPFPALIDHGTAQYRYSSPVQITVTGGIPINKPPYSVLTALDLNEGEIRWQVPLGDLAHVRDHPLLRGADLPPLLGGAFGNAGALVTGGGLVFISAGVDELYAFDKDDGRLLWAGALPAGGEGSPMTYRTESGRQFVVIATGMGAGATLVSFTLGGTAAQ